MGAPASAPLVRERRLILGVLIALAAAAWAVMIWQSSATGAQGAMGMGLTMGMTWPVFLAVWVAMMAAMMFPAAAPMILMFATISVGKRQRTQAFVPTWVFVLAYLLVWAAAGLLGYALALGGDALGSRSPWLADHARQVTGALLVVAGLYQLTPLKRACLARCRTPLQFIMTSWRDGYGGALRMGIAHGVYCLGCCWLLFVILFPLGIMNIALMAVLTAVIFAEKVLPVGRLTVGLVAGALLLYGVLLLFVPGVPGPGGMMA